MGVVYLGKDPRIGRVVAIKTMPLDQEFEGAELDEMRDRFFREAQAAGRLSHPSIVTVYDVGEEHDLAYMAMDYLTGVSLEKHCKAPALLPYDDVFAICIQVAEALDFAHGQRVVHRDIKPANIIWDPAAKRAKLTDFGVACLIDASKTKTGTVLGSPSYMSPEQVAGAHVDGRSDIFSLGVMLYQLLSGELPFKASQMTTLMYKIANEKHTDVRTYNPRLPPCVGAIVNTALQKDPAKRFPSAGKLAEALKVCRQQKPAY
jgi:serine/threonine-protein kinase